MNWGITPPLEAYLGDSGLLFSEIARHPPEGYIMNAIQHAYAFNPWAGIGRDLVALSEADGVLPEPGDGWVGLRDCTTLLDENLSRRHYEH